MERDQALESVRGLTIIGVVLHHLINQNADSVHDLVNWFNVSFVYVRMPMFTALSGYVYGMRPVGATSTSEFLLKKMRRLFIPFVSLTLLVGGLRALGFTTVSTWAWSDVAREVFYPSTQYWFLVMLIGVFCVIAALERFRLLQSPLQLVGIALISYVASYFCPRDLIFGLEEVLFFLPAFLAGLFVVRFPTEILRVDRGLLVVAIIVMAMQQVVIYFCGLNENSLIPKRGVWAMLFAPLVCTCVLSRRRYLNSKIMSVIGKYAYPIFLLDIFGIALGKRILVLDADQTLYLSVFVLQFVLALSLPVIGYLVLSRIPFLRLLIFGEVTRPEKTYQKSRWGQA